MKHIKEFESLFLGSDTIDINDDYPFRKLKCKKGKAILMDKEIVVSNNELKDLMEKGLVYDDEYGYGYAQFFKFNDINKIEDALKFMRSDEYKMAKK